LAGPGPRDTAGGGAPVRDAPLLEDGADGGFEGADGVALGSDDRRGGSGGGLGKDGGLGGSAGPELGELGAASAGSMCGSLEAFGDGSSAMVVVRDP
jgi:hypothetical protein